MKFLFLIVLVFMVSCQPQPEVEALLSEGDTVARSVNIPYGDELFNSFDVSSEYSAQVLSSNGAHFRSTCLPDPSGLYYQQSFYISQDGVGVDEFKLTLIRYFSYRNDCTNPVGFYHASSMYVDISDFNRVTVSDYGFMIDQYEESDNVLSYDDCDYSRNIIGSGCVFDVMNGGFTFEVIDATTVKFNGIRHRR